MIHQHSTCCAKKSFYIKSKRNKNSLSGYHYNLFLLLSNKKFFHYASMKIILSTSVNNKKFLISEIQTKRY